MVFKGWFKGSQGNEPSRAADELTIEDLIVLERYAEAEERLKSSLKADPDDLHAHLKLAEVYTGLGRGESAAEQYGFVADGYAEDGFYDKGIALLAKAMKLSPADQALRHKLYAFERAKGLEHKRAAAVEGLRSNRLPGVGSGTQILRVQRYWPQLAVSPLLQRIGADQLRRLFSGIEPVRLDPGTELVARGSDRQALWIVVNGAVQVVLERPDGSTTELRRFGPGDIVGEAALFNHEPWPASYWVAEPSLLLLLDRTGLEHTLAGNSDPVGFLEALRCDGNDADIARIVAQLEARG